MKNNPWKSINLDDYENHMLSENVRQLQALNQIMKEQIEQYPIRSVSILGVAGGNGLEHVDPNRVKQVYGIDINQDYLNACKQRHPQLNGIFSDICMDLKETSAFLPKTDLVIANLFIEYVGIDFFCDKIVEAGPRYISCVIQENKDRSFVSETPYEKELSSLADIYKDIQSDRLIFSIDRISYSPTLMKKYDLPNGKIFHRIDFELNKQLRIVE